MLRPVLLVGVGGSGGKTLRAMRQTLLRRLRQNGWTKNQLPEGWQMLWVDSVSQQDEDAFHAPLLPNDQYVGLVTPGLRYSDLRTSLEQTVPAQRMDALAGWVPDTVPIAVAAGAGQARAIGRVISASQLRLLKQRMDDSYRRLSGPSVTSELADVARLLGEQDGAALTEPIALVVSSMAGGSGSGMFLDVVETLKGVDASFKEPGTILTVLYTPDVFDSIKGAGDQIPPNTLAAVMEATAGVFAPGLTPATEALLASQGVVARSRHGFGSKANFLVGARNARISLGSQEAIYHAVGDSLSAIVADSNVQQTLRAFTITNVFLNSGLPMNVLDNSKLSDANNDDESMPFSALGMARITLGTDRLADYVTKLVARDITEYLLWPDFQPAYRDDGQRIPDQERIEERIVERWRTHNGQSGFLIASGLNERDPADDVIDALVDKDRQEARLAEWATGIVSRAKQNVDSKGMPPAEWVNRLDREFRERLEPLRQTETADRYGFARSWTVDIQDTIGTLVVTEAVASGLIVTAALLDRLIEEMTYVTEELKTQAATARGKVDLVHGSLSRILNDAGSAWIGADDDILTRAKKALILGAQLAVDADRRELGAALIADLTSGYLRPLAESVKTSRARLNDNVVSDRIEGGQVNPWPTMPQFDSPVPTQFHPGTTERMLIDVASFPTVVKEQVSAALKDKEQASWRHLLRHRTAAGQSLSNGEPMRSSILETRSPWSPQDARATDTALGGAKGQFRMPQKVSEIEELTMAYLSDANASQTIARFLRQGIADYTRSGTPEQQVARQNALMAALRDAVQVAAPFVQVNAAVKAHLHPNVSDQLQLVVTTIPFPAGDALFDGIKNILVNAGLWSDTQSPQWFRTDGTSEITLFTMTGKAMLPMVFDNVMKPISESWARNSGDPATRHAFWSKRRARPLVECIPASPEVVVAMLRGWFLAGLLNQRQVSDEGTAGYRARIWDPETRSVVDFPFPMLSGSPISQNDVPAAMLKSVAIAMVKVNEVGDLSPLAPYRRLIDLGNPFTASATIARWISEGTVADVAAPVPDPGLAGPAGDGGIADQRRNAVASTLERTRLNFEKEFDDAEFRNDPFATPIVWEVREYVRQAIRDLTSYLTTAQDSASSGSL